MTPNKIIPIFDGHNDSIQSSFLGKRGEGKTIVDDTDEGHVTIKKAKQGGMIGGFFAIQTPPENSEERAEDYGFHINESGYYIDIPSRLRQEYAEDFTNQVLDYANKLITANSTKLKLIKSVTAIDTNLDAPLSLLLHLEGAEAVKEDLSNLPLLYDKGVRSIGLFWSRPNAFGTGVQYKFPSSPDIGGGLTLVGKQLIKECNRLGIIVDLAHINEKGFWDAAKVSDKPLVITHTTVNALCNTSRSINDRQIDAVGHSNGVIGILFEPIMINKLGLSLPKDKALDDVFADLIQMPIIEIVKHIDYIVKKIGVDHVAFGADMDGAMMPIGLEDASKFQNIVKELFAYGYDVAMIEKICYKNWLRVIKDTIG